MRATYEFKCTPPNEASRVVRIDAATYEEAFQRAAALWCRQMHPPILLCRIAREPQTALAFGDDVAARREEARRVHRLSRPGLI